jgi:tetratricopeptide (TPR) repeat protein
VSAASRQPNDRLRSLIKEARWTGQGLARAVNRAGAELGLELTYDRTSVAHWLSGSRPPAAVARLVAEALTRRLGRAVTVADTGLGPPGLRAAAATLAGPYSAGDGVAQLADLSAAEGDPTRRAALRDLVYSVAALRSVDGSWPKASTSSGDGWASRGSPRAQAVRTMTGLFSTADRLFGGGHVRPALTAYLAGDAAHWLREPGSSAARRELAAAVAELGYLAAFVSFDCGLHGLAQRYYLASLDLAESSGDEVLRATILRGMSVQAYTLRHTREALQLAEVAHAHHGLPPGRAAAVAGQLAVASAANGLHRDAAKHLRRAEALLEAEDPGDPPVGAYHLASFYHQTAEVLAAAGDTPGAIEALSAAIRQRPAGERRSRAITVARLAELQLDLGHLEAACASISSLCDDHPYLHSAREADLLDGLSGRLRSYARNSEARTLLARIRTLGE